MKKIIVISLSVLFGLSLIFNFKMAYDFFQNNVILKAKEEGYNIAISQLGEYLTKKKCEPLEIQYGENKLSIIEESCMQSKK